MVPNAQLLSKVLGFSVFLTVGTMRIPQIFAFVKAKSSKGLAVSSLIVEILGVSLFIGYAYLSKFPLSSYGETYLLVAQDMIILWLVLYYENLWSLSAVALNIAYFMYAASIFTYAFPLKLAQYAVIPSLPLPLLSMVLQIKEIRLAKSSGELSTASFVMGSYGAMVRVFTTVVELDDKMLLCNAILIAILSTLLAAHVKLYKEPGSDTLAKKE